MRTGEVICQDRVVPPPFVTRLRNLRSAIERVRYLNQFEPDELHSLLDMARWHAHENLLPRRSPTIHPTAVISPMASLRFIERVEIGPRANIGPFAAIWGGWSDTWIRVGAGAMISQCCTLVAGNHSMEGRGWIRETGFDEADVVIGEGAWVSAGATVIGCNVGIGAVVGAGAIVTKDIPDYAIAVGVPARVIGYRPGVEPPEASDASAA
jgi:acetyltransferase-like isoleucine patch superfamily enzyme